jgi:hypothetical protein
MQTVGKVVFSSPPKVVFNVAPEVVELKNLLNAAIDKVDDPAQEEFIREIANTAYWVGYYDGIQGKSGTKVKVETMRLVGGKKRYTKRISNSKKRIQNKKGA